MEVITDKFHNWIKCYIRTLAFHNYCIDIIKQDLFFDILTEQLICVLRVIHFRQNDYKSIRHTGNRLHKRFPKLNVIIKQFLRLCTEHPCTADEMIYADILFLLIRKVVRRKWLVLCLRNTYQFAFFVKNCRIELRLRKRTLNAREIINIKHICKPRRSLFKFRQSYIMLFPEFIIHKVVARGFKICGNIAHSPLKPYRSAVFGIDCLAWEKKPVIYIIHHKPAMCFKTLFLVLRNVGEHLGYRRDIIGIYKLQKWRICLLRRFSRIYRKGKISWKPYYYLYELLVVGVKLHRFRLLGLIWSMIV